MKCRLAVAALGLLLSACYVPTESRIYRNLELTNAGDDEAALRQAFLEKLPAGTPRQQVQAVLDRQFRQRDPLARIHDPDDNKGITLSVAYDVNGLAVCKDNVNVQFRFNGDALGDVKVSKAEVCL